jgi:hypothetical protein
VSPDAARNVVALHQERPAKASASQADKDLDVLVLETVIILTEAASYPATAAGDAMLVRDAHAYLAHIGPTLTNAEICAALGRWQNLVDALVDYD